jgi:hypothetical protein
MKLNLVQLNLAKPDLNILGSSFTNGSKKEKDD